MIVPSRRGFVAGVVGLIASPAIVKAASLVPVSAPRAVSREEFLRRFQMEVLEAYSAGMQDLMLYGTATIKVESIGFEKRVSYVPLSDLRWGESPVKDYLRSDGTTCAASRFTA